MIKDKTLINWNDKLSVGIESIDSQHKVLIQIINQLFSMIMEPNNTDDLRPIFAKLTMYTKEHFAYEESLFDKHQFPLTNEHKNEHQIIIKKLNQLSDQYKDSSSFDSSVIVMEFLKEWLENHILKCDSQYSSYLLDHGVQ